MKLLLDTHALIWFMDDSPQLPVPVAQQFVNVANTLYISRISLLEIAIKSQLSKDDSQLDFEQ